MKKLLFLVPLVLLALNATPIALYKNTVNYSPNGQLFHLLPSYWRQLNMKVNNVSTYQPTISVGTAGTPPSIVPISKGAKFYGFPVGFYFKNTNVINSSLYGIPYTVTAFSWLWAIVDGVLIIITLLIAILLNRHHPSNILNTAQATPIT